MSEEQIDQIVQFYKTNTIFRLQKIIPIITERLEAELEKNGIPARVAARVKKPASLRGKLLKWVEKLKSGALVGYIWYCFWERKLGKDFG